ncbi:AraC family transcriptional regulator [Paenibacillus sp. GCM10027626]|uniref:AraC family transcriptional regulator n=1 Tax=Paenibacillus sp. GCM10027626 TaxID=3273411 RepID=UPI003644BF1D
MVKWRKNSILYVWLRSYALVLLIPVVMTGIVYVQTNKVIEDEINSANSSLLRQLQEEIDSQIEHVQRMREAIAFNARVRKLLFVPQEPGADHRLAMVQAFADFRTYSSTNRYIDNFFIYFRNGNFILDDRSYYKPELYYELYIEKTGASYEEWLAFLEDQHRGAFVNGQDIGMKQEKGDILLSQSLPIENTGSRLATLVIYMNKERLQTSLRNIQSYNKGDVYIIDGDNRILASSGDAMPMLPLNFQLTEHYGVTEDKSGNQDVVVSYIKSALTDWAYVYSLPSGVYREKVEYVRDLSILMVIIALVLGAATAIYTARRNYNPIKQIVNTLAVKSKLEPVRAGNEIHYIGESLEQALDQNIEMNRVIEQQNVFLRSNLIVRLLKGRLESNYPLEEALAEYRLNMGLGPYAVMLFYIEDFNGLLRDEELDPEKNLRFVHLIISNIVEEMIGKHHRGWVSEVDEMLACVVNFMPNTEPLKAKEYLLQLAEEARAFIGQRFQIEFTCALSAVHPSIQSIPAAYRETLEAMEYRMLMGSSTTIDYESIQVQGNGYVYPLEMEQQLINHIKSGNYEKAKSIMDEVIETNLQEGLLSADLAHCFMFDMISTMMKASMEAVSAQSELYEENRKAVQAILQEQTIGDMRHRMTLFLQQVCSHVNARKKSHNVKLIDDLLAYIGEHYSDPNVSVAGLSEHFNLHPSYLSRFFKEQIGDNLSDYLNRYRMQQAKRLLMEEEVVIKAVSEAVGIFSISTFIRLFKKYEGVTPGVYREMNKKAASSE